MWRIILQQSERTRHKVGIWGHRELRGTLDGSSADGS
jgi:hypothetical protein